MKKFNFNPNALTAGVALALGLVSGSANASTTTSQSSTAGTISNTAEATYSVDGVAQPKVTSNAVVVNTSEVANFTLVATQGASATDDKNEAQVATPGQATTFTNTLTNTGNLSDTYTLNITQNNEGTIQTGNQDYKFTSPTAITYVIKNADGSTPTAAQLAAGQAQTGTVATSVPLSKPWLLGIANVRGRLLPITNLSNFLGLPPSSSNYQSANQKILVIDQPKLFSGLQVDEILGIQTFSQGQYQPIEMPNDSPLAQYTHGRFKQNEQIWYVFMPSLLAQDTRYLEAAL